MRLATHCRDSWVRRLRAPARMRPPLGDRFLMDYFPRPLEGRRPYCRMPKGTHGRHPGASHSPPRSAAARMGRAVALRARLEHGAPSCATCKTVGWGISRCCRAGHEWHTDPSAGLRCPRVPPRVAPSRHVLVPEDRRAGAAALSSWIGRARPASQALPASGPPASRGAPPPPPPQDARHPPLLCTGAWQPHTPETPNA